MSDVPPPGQEPLIYETPRQLPGKNDWMGVTALVLGIVNMLSWVIPLCGCPVGLAGIVFGIMGMTMSGKRGMSLAGLIMSVLSILLTIGNAAAGAWMQAHHKGIWAP